MVDVARRLFFRTEEGDGVPAVTAEEMREADRIAMEEFGLGMLQMMENAGRNVAQGVLSLLDGVTGDVTVLAGSGGNGGGGLCCARHLHNRGFKVRILLDGDESTLSDAATNQLRILRAAGVQPSDLSQASEFLRGSKLVVDALIGYGLRGAPRGETVKLIDLCNQHGKLILSLDVPSGLNATTGEAPGLVVRPNRTVTLALPKTGLKGASGHLYLADIGIPPQVFHRLGLSFESPFKRDCCIRLVSTQRDGSPTRTPPDR